jgi:hypothetical protein
MSIAPCPPPSPVQRGVVVFDPAAFKTAFPMFATVADVSLTLCFSIATLSLNNSCSSRVCDAAERELLLNLLTAHLAQLNFGVNGQPPAGIVGRIDKASEGSVSVGADMGTVVYGQAWFNQTQWGATYWMATAKYRTAVYIPAPTVCADLGSLGGLGYYGGSGWPGDGGCGC